MDDTTARPDQNTDDRHPAGTAAATLLEMAARDADAWKAEAKGEADEVVRTARAEAERLTSTARSEADEMLTRARAEVARLQRIEAEHRDRLRTHAQSLLDQVGQPNQQ